MTHPFPGIPDAHRHDDQELAQDHRREDLRRHLVGGHHWPAVARDDASAADLDDLHLRYHDPDRRADAVRRTRQILGMPEDDDDR